MGQMTVETTVSSKGQTNRISVVDVDLDVCAQIT